MLKELEERMYDVSSPYTEALDSVTQILRNIMKHHAIVPLGEVEYRIRGRIKKLEDIREKVQRKNLSISSITDLENGIDDIVGTRCIVDYISQVYKLQSIIQSRQEWKLSKPIDDYIKSPTPTGYRSLHIVIMLDTTNFQNVLAEIQLRTMLQDAWATKTHPLTYKKEAKDIPEPWLELIRHLSDSIHTCDEMFDTIRDQL